MTKSPKDKASRGDKSQTFSLGDYFSKQELQTLYVSLLLFQEITGDQAKQAVPILKKIEANLPKPRINFGQEIVAAILEKFSLDHYEEGRNYQYNHDHRWDFKKRYIEMNPEMEQVLIQAWQKRVRVWIEYPSSDGRNDNKRIARRKIDIYDIEGGYISGYCHLRKDERTFRIDRIISVRPTKERYKILAE